MKKLWLSVLFLLTSSVALANPDFSLTIDNNTNSTFQVKLNGRTYLNNLQPGESGKIYELSYDYPEQKFAVLFTAIAGPSVDEKASVWYRDGTLSCNPQTTFYQCHAEKTGDNSGFLSLSKD